MSTPSAQSWSLFIFCYNEGETIARVITQALEVGEELTKKQKPFEVIVVDDGSRDETFIEAWKVAEKESRVRVIRHPFNLGIGGALRTGYENARYENVTALPGDGQYNLKELLKYSEVRDGSFVSFVRRKQSGYSSFRTFLSRANRAVNTFILGYKFQDVNWVKIYKTESLKKIDLKLTSSLVESEICSKLVYCGYECVETPSDYLARTAGKSTAASLKSLGRVAGEMFKLARVIWLYRNEKLKKSSTAALSLT